MTTVLCLGKRDDWRLFIWQRQGRLPKVTPQYHQEGDTDFHWVKDIKEATAYPHGTPWCRLRATTAAETAIMDSIGPRLPLPQRPLPRGGEGITAEGV